ncbi:MAG: hypothetical protein HUJ31_10200 [Pseudomonadales bacterium]|nr:hypothetical protein [Pseudomonadales bacterium]
MKAISEVDLVIDATAETNVTFYISSLCEKLKTSFVWATATQGGWGGIVGKVVPEVSTGSWLDFSHQYAEGKISVPPAEEGSDVQGVGCFDQTFTGTGFDLDHVSLMATRVAIATLGRRKAVESYPDFDWDVGVLGLWDESLGIPSEPRWKTYKI